MRKCTLLSAVVGWVLIVSAAHAIEIVGFDAGRGGISSIASSAGYASTRSQIVASFPGSTFGGLPALTADALQNADVLWLGVTFSNVASISPLTAAEQQVLRDFLLGGGIALLFGDNDAYSASAQAVNNSFFGQFAVHSTGTIFSGSQSYILVSPSQPPLSGPVGPVTSLVSGFPGWFDVLPAEAQVITRITANNNPSIVHIADGALGPGSGNLWLFSDTGAQSSGGAQGTAWTTLYVNILSMSSMLPGDFNNDGAVNAPDYVVWRTNVGTSNVLPNDPVGGVIGASQFGIWRANFGDTFPGSGVGAGSFVPEPASIVLLLSGGMVALAWRHSTA